MIGKVVKHLTYDASFFTCALIFKELKSRSSLMYRYDSLKLILLLCNLKFLNLSFSLSFCPLLLR